MATVNKDFISRYGIQAGGNIKGTTLQSTVSTGTAPLTVASSTLVTNLNAQYLNGNPSSAFVTNVMTTLGDIVYGGAAGAFTRLAGNTTINPQFLTSTGAGGLATAPTWTGSTGSGTVVLSTSPSLTTPSLGVASATSINKVTLTTPATGSTLTILDGKTLTVNNSITLAASADGNTLNIGGGGTLGTAAFTASTAYQAASTELAAIVTASVANGFLKRTGTNTWTIDTSTYLTSATGVTSVNGATGAITNVAKTTDKLSVFAATTSAELAGVISDETGGAGVLMFNASPAVSTSLTTASSSFDLINTTATTVNFAGASTALNIGSGTGTTTFGNNVIVGGDLTVNGVVTSINSSTLTVDDKNIEMGAVVSGIVSASGTVSGSGTTGTITGMASTAGLVVGSTITSTPGTGNTGTTTVVASIVSKTSITITAASGIAAGTVTNITGGAPTDATADGGGIILKGATDKSIVWDNANDNWTTSENWNIVTGKTLKINNANIISGSATALVIGEGASTTIAIGANGGTMTLLNPTVTLTNATTLNATNLTTASIATAATGATTVNIGTAATSSGTKTINIGTAGTTGSTTTIVIGTTAGTTPTVRLNGAVTLGSLASAGIVHTSAAGLLSTSVVTNAELANSTIVLGSTTLTLGATTTTVAGLTLTSPVIDAIAASGAAATPTLWSTVTTGSITIGAGLTTGALNIATAGSSATPIGIGHTNSITTFSGTVVLPTGTTKVGQTFLLQGGAVNITLPTAAGTLVGTGDTGSVSGTMIAGSAVSYAKIQNVSTNNRVLGRITAGAGVVEELTGDNLAAIINSGTTAVTSATQLHAVSASITSKTVTLSTNGGSGTLDSFTTNTQYRTARYLIQAVQVGTAKMTTTTFVVSFDGTAEVMQTEYGIMDSVAGATLTVNAAWAANTLTVTVTDATGTAGTNNVVVKALVEYIDF